MRFPTTRPAYLARHRASMGIKMNIKQLIGLRSLDEQAT